MKKTSIAIPSVLVAALVACSPGVTVEPAPPAGPDWNSGTRLRARIVDDGHGVTAFDGARWRDTAFGELCQFGTAEDGRDRCLPAGVAGYAGDSVVPFLDAACSQRGVQLPPGAAPPKHVIQSTTNPEVCGGQSSVVYEVGGPIASVPLYYLYNGECTPLLATPGGSLRALGARVAPAAFVAGHSTVEPRGGGLSVVIWQTDDGARILEGGFDTKRGARCFDESGFVAPGEPGDIRCLPADAVPMSGYADPACTGPTPGGGAEPGSPCPAPTLGYTSSPGCGTPPRIYALGAPAPPAKMYVDDVGTCLGDGVGAVYPATTEIAAEQFPALALAHEGAGRLRRSHLVTPDGQSLQGGGLFDSARGRRCWPEQLADGVWRCVGGDRFTTQPGRARFADPACTRELAWRYPSGIASPCDAPEHVFRDGDAVDELGGAIVAEVYAAGPKLVGSTVYAQSDQGCTAMTVTEHDVFYELGPKVDFSVFATVTLRDE